MSKLPDDDSVFVPREGSLEDDLPPVEPPSAGFIVKLFLVPMLIVLSIVGVWALFGQLASGKQDMAQIVADLRNTNPHRRWRAASTLAHVLKADQQLGKDGAQLSQDVAVAQALTDLLKEELAQDSREPDQLQQQAFLTRALGWFDVPDVVLPVLQEAMRIPVDPVSDETSEQTVRELQQELRRSAVVSVAQIADRAEVRGASLDIPILVDDLIEVSADREPAMRQLGAFALGLMASKRSKERLEFLLIDADDKVQLNAALGLARQKSAAGFEIFAAVFEAAMQPIDVDDDEANAQERRQLENERTFERNVSLKNSLKAVAELANQFETHQSERLVRLIEPISQTHPNGQIRVGSADALQVLRNSESPE